MAFDSSSTLQQTDEVAAVASGSSGAGTGGGVSTWDDLTGELSGPVPFDATDDDGNPTSRSLRFLNVTPQVDVTSDPANGIALEIKDQTNGTRLGTLTTDGRWETRGDMEAFADGSFGSGSSTNSLLQVEDAGTALTTDAASIDFTGSGVNVSVNGDDVTVDVSGGSGSDIDIEDNQTVVVGGATGLSFEGSGIDSVDNDGDGTATVNISKGSSTEVQEGGTAQVSDVTTLDFVGGDFSVANPTSGEAEVSLQNDSVTVAGNSVSLGGSTGIAHGDLSSIGSSDHHPKTTSASDLKDVSADSVTDAHHPEYTDEKAQDAVNALLSSGSGISLNYDDINNDLTITSTVTNTDTQTDLENSGGVVVSDADAMSFEAGANTSVTVSSDNDGTGTVLVSSTDTDTQLSNSEVKTAIEAATSDVAIDISGDADTLDGVQLSNINFADIAATRYRDEEAQDAINNLLTGGSGITLSYDDPNNTLTITNTVSNTNTQTDLENSAGVVVTDADAMSFEAGANSTVSVSSDNDGTGTVLISSTDTDTQLTDSEVKTAIENATSDVAIDISGDADTLDGHDESYFAALAESETVTAGWSFNNSQGGIRLVNSNDTTHTIRIGQHGGASDKLRWVPYIADGSTGYQFNQDFSFNFSSRSWFFDPNVGFGGETDPSYAVETAGDMRATGEVEAFLGSDRRLKTALDPLDSALDKVDQLTGYGFDWREADAVQPHKRGKTDVGLIAQEVEGVLPEAVREFQDGHSEGYKSVSYDKLVPLLVEAIKDLRQQIEK